MSNKRHTPGPWYIGKDFSDQGRHIYAEQMVCDDDGESWHPLIAATDDDERLVDWQANAVLIAAAPDLLEALNNCLDWMESMRASGDSGNWDWKDDEYTKGVAAINKATSTI